MFMKPWMLPLIDSVTVYKMSRLLVICVIVLISVVNSLKNVQFLNALFIKYIMSYFCSCKLRFGFFSFRDSCGSLVLRPFLNAFLQVFIYLIMLWLYTNSQTVRYQCVCFVICSHIYIAGRSVCAAKVQYSAPDFKGTAVVDGAFKEIKLSDYAGQYLVLFFYPLDL